jgi:hypothetical protein
MRIERFTWDQNAPLIFHEPVGDFSPDQPRVPAGEAGGGQWTSGGGGEAGAGPEGFVSPNVATNVNFAQAAQALTSAPQHKLTAVSSYIDSQLGLHGASNKNVIGAWADGAENSLMVVAPGASPDVMRAAMAMKGYLADQKSVLMFQPHEDGTHLMLSFPQTGKLDDIHTDLLKKDVAFHTLEPTGQGAIVHVFASDQATVDAVGKAAGAAPVEYVRGHGEFIGTQKETGSDREQRDDARRVYEKVIAEAGRSHALAGQDVAKVWQDARDRWQSLSAAEAPVGATTAPPVVAYHGTIDSVVDKIKAEGLHVTAKDHHFDGMVYAGDRGESVFVTTNMKTAADYAGSYAQSKSWQEMKSVTPVVFKLEVPAAEWTKFHEDTLEKGAYYTHAIPPAWIKGAFNIEYGESGKPGVPGPVSLVARDKAADVTTDADKVTAYMVIFVSEPTGRK